MFKFIVKRVLLSLLILFFVMFIVYTLMYSLPTSYMEKTAREMASRPGSLKSYQDWLNELNAQYGMDKGLIPGFFTWLGSAVTGNFGDSWYWTKPVTTMFSESIWYSFILNVIALVIPVSVAIPLGVLAARKQYSITDYSVTVFALIGISLPSFFLATILKMVFGIKLGWFETSGMQSRDYVTLDAFGKVLDLAWHMVLPAANLCILSIGDLMRYTRTNMLEVLNADYIRTARAKGLAESKVINRHAFRNTLIPIVTMMGGWLAGLFGGSLITETLFGIRGIGFVSYNSMINGDIPFTMFYLAFSALLTMIGTLLSDILYAVVDPRVRIN